MCERVFTRIGWASAAFPGSVARIVLPWAVRVGVFAPGFPVPWEPGVFLAPLA
jgi:hypothetical protein